jgi:hypothetical protein
MYMEGCRFFYYVIHFFLIHGFLVVLFYSRGFTNKDIITPGAPFFFTPPGLGRFAFLGLCDLGKCGYIIVPAV